MVSTVKPAERRRGKHTSSVSVAKPKQINLAVKRVLKAGGSNFSFPPLSGAEAAALMKAAGILTGSGKLAKKYR